MLRSPGEPQLVATVKQLGAKASTLAYSELYLALEQGVVDGQFNPVNSIFESSFYEVQDYIAMVNMIYYFANFTMNKELYDSLDTNLQKIVQEAAMEAAIASREALTVKEEKYMKQMESSFKEITYPDLEPFRVKVAPVYDEFRKIAGEQTVNDFLRIVKEYREK